MELIHLTGLAEAISQQQQQQNEQSDTTTILPEAAIARLREAAPRYLRENPYGKGDIVTPYKDTIMRGHGRPFLVIETHKPEKMVPTCQPGHMLDARPNLDIRLITVASDGDIHVFWSDSANFELFDPNRKYDV